MLNPKEQMKRNQMKKSKKINKVSVDEIKSYNFGINVTHKTFGDGKIRSVNDGIIDVEFKKHGLKRFSLMSCLENDLLKKVAEI